ncbi:MAG: hypothetical protein F4Z10_09715 [Synechococcus sp. SB0666_bin_14]|nr:hypothetical protein [Synechococcus sp. SB0666_bin_14]MYG46887.1 hypothetical protein [Synechococcus sp. SB0675_bin_6]MYK91246.1 hypothetical protein [Synechococcus sp. SB0669_bin_8]
MATLERSKLYVEGKDDLHVISNLLEQYVNSSEGHGVAPNASELKEMNCKEALLRAVQPTIEVEVGNGKSVGFVLDADENPRARWSAVRSRLQRVRLSPLQEANLDLIQEIELDVPEEMPAGGYVTHVEECGVRIGV